MNAVAEVEQVHRQPDRYIVTLWRPNPYDDGVALVELKWLDDDVGAALICRFHKCYISLHSKTDPLCGCLRDVMRWRHAATLETDNED